MHGFHGLLPLWDGPVSKWFGWLYVSVRTRHSACGVVRTPMKSEGSHRYSVQTHSHRCTLYGVIFNLPSVSVNFRVWGS
jgi:hypothetical protein